jgi:hypothetical protein
VSHLGIGVISSSLVYLIPLKSTATQYVCSSRLLLSEAFQPMSFGQDSPRGTGQMRGGSPAKLGFEAPGWGRGGGGAGRPPPAPHTGGALE